MTKKRAYTRQRASAKWRNIPFFLTFDEWWGIWKKSGNWHKRGRGIGKYCMSRFGDKGAYEVQNVEIVLFEKNNKSFVHSSKAKQTISRKTIGQKNPRATMTDETAMMIKTDYMLATNKYGLIPILAKRYGSTKDRVGEIVRGRTFKHVVTR